MRITRLGGIISDGDTLNSGEAVDVLFEAGGAIPINAPCIVDTNVNGYTAVVCTAASDSAFVGVYQGEGSGFAAQTTSVGPRDAASGDFIFIRAYGLCTALTGGAVTAGDTVSTGGGVFITAPGTIAADAYGVGLALETDGGSPAVSRCFVKAL